MSLSREELAQEIKKGDKKALQALLERFEIHNLSDKELVLIHQYSDGKEASEEFWRRHEHRLAELGDEEILVLVQAGYQPATDYYVNKYRKRIEEAPDEALVLLTQEGDEDAFDHLVERYFPDVKDMIVKKKYYFRGLGKWDLIQEGMVGLFKSIHDFKVERKSKFQRFSKFVIKKHMGTLIIKSMNKKNLALNESLSFNAPMGSDSDITFEQTMRSNTYKPLESGIAKETYKDIYKKFTKLEKDVLRLRDEGYSYEEIAEMVGKNIKAIDNARQRIRIKGEKYIEQYK